MTPLLKKIIIQIDGAAKGNPGPAGIGVVFETEQKKILKEISKFIGNKTNNQAEYEALITALKILHTQAKELGVDLETEIVIKTDSQLLFNQINGGYKIRNRILQKLFFEVMWLKRQWRGIKVLYVPREKNRPSDRLAKSAIKSSYHKTRSAICQK